ncbi:MAG TPA: SelB C-terminal domain-containing protein, partial [candidate division Zixibacteria bacterium]|nr:SelB C-terminal domain-containing protein [candidate division Zixibacteria bacterium]
TGKGFEKLKDLLNDLSIKIKAGQDIGKARLYIDRVFVRPGFGAVATGTLKDGSLSVGDKVTIWPSNKSAKIKSLQSNNQNVNKSHPSQRTAVSLTGLDKSELNRGGVITRIEDVDFIVRNPILALKIELLKTAPITIENKRRAVLLVGTSETEGDLRLFSGVRIERGQSGVVFFKPKTPVFTLVGDRVILRLPSPSVTLGGGVVLDHLKAVPSQKEVAEKDYLQNRDVAFLEQLIISELQKSIVVNESELLKYSSRSQEEISAVVRELLKSSRFGKSGEYIFENSALDDAAGELLHIVNTLFSSKNSITGLTLKEIAKACSLGDEVASVIAQSLVNRNQLRLENDSYRPVESQTALSVDIQSAYNDIMKELKKNPFMPPELEKLAAKGKSYKEAIRLMLKSGEIYKCGQEFVFLRTSWKEIESFIIKSLQHKNELKVGELRDKFKFTRKYAIPILEETDRIKLTKRQGDIRVRGESFEK